MNKSFKTIDITLDVHIIKINNNDDLVTNDVYIRGAYYNLYYNEKNHCIYAMKSYS
jgi:hypothetical protein